MNLYTIVTNDAYELPVLCDVRVKEAAAYLSTTPEGIRRMICRPPKRSAYKPVITGKVKHDPRKYYRKYSQTHDRTEYRRKYYQDNKDKIKEKRRQQHEKTE
ncbi:MAG: hypothetical protein HDR02_15150 [Lachnospiraceae bacterium]|nr:hypothetical protein [Lachnospiraceae bacterium]